jgi:hypothetical protein
MLSAPHSNSDPLQDVHNVLFNNLQLFTYEQHKYYIQESDIFPFISTLPNSIF